MNLELYNGVFSPLREKWPNHFTAHIMEQIFHLVKTCPESAFKKLCSELVWNTPFKPPTIGEFVSFSREYSPKADPLAGMFCDFCGYTGSVSAEGHDGKIYAFRCQCPNGKDNPTHLKIDGRTKYWQLWTEVAGSGFYARIKPVDPTLRFLSDEDKEENWKFLWDVLDRKISQDEINGRLEMMKNAIEYAKENRRRAAP